MRVVGGKQRVGPLGSGSGILMSAVLGRPMLRGGGFIDGFVDLVTVFEIGRRELVRVGALVLGQAALE
jgi:hypothetical protein